jgi:hypothetical protein
VSVFVLTLVVIIMTALLPELDVEDVGRDDLLVAARRVLVLDQAHQLVVDAGAVGKEEGGTGTPEYTIKDKRKQAGRKAQEKMSASANESGWDGRGRVFAGVSTDHLWKKKSSCCCPMRRWSRSSAIFMNAFHSLSLSLLGKEMPYTRCRDAFSALASQ